MKANKVYLSTPYQLSEIFAISETGETINAIAQYLYQWLEQKSPDNVLRDIEQFKENNLNQYQEIIE